MIDKKLGNVNLVIESRAVHPFYKNGYLIGKSDSFQVVYVDPGDEVELILDLIDERQLELVAILLTHAHIDHVSGVSRVREKHLAPIYLHPKDLPLYEALPQQAEFFGVSCFETPPIDEELFDHQILQVAGIQLKVHFTPGHSPGHVCLEVGQHVFCGDVLFQGSIGRTDLPGGSYEVLIQTIQERIIPLGDDRILYPGHGPQTTIKQERRSNPFLIGSL